MAKDAGAKGIIIITSNMENTFQPYSDYSDNTFLVFIADSKTTKDVLISSTFILLFSFYVYLVILLLIWLLCKEEEVGRRKVNPDKCRLIMF